MTAFIIFVIGLAIYLIPTFVAFGREHGNRVAILCLNIFLGWTFLGWVAALVWSFTDNVKK